MEDLQQHANFNFTRNQAKNIINRYVPNMQSYSPSLYNILQTKTQGHSTCCRCICGQGNYELFQLKLAKLLIKFLKKENDKVVRETVDEEKKSFLNYLRISISKIVLAFFIKLCILFSILNCVCIIFIRNKRKLFVSNP